jgi:hypothetical protein
VSLRRQKGGTCVEPDSGFIDDERIRRKAGISESVRYDEEISSADRYIAEGNLSGCLDERHSDASLKPLAIRVDEGHQRERRVARLGGQQGKIIEVSIRRSIENAIIMKSGEAIVFIVSDHSSNVRSAQLARRMAVEPVGSGRIVQTLTTV